MLAKLFIGLMHIFERRPRQLELAARLETHRAAFRAILAAQRDDVALLGDGVPAEAILQRFEQRADAALALVRHRRVALAVEAELLVLGADAPIGLRLGARLEIGNKLVP